MRCSALSSSEITRLRTSNGNISGYDSLVGPFGVIQMQMCCFCNDVGDNSIMWDNHRLGFTCDLVQNIAKLPKRPRTDQLSHLKMIRMPRQSWILRASTVWGRTAGFDYLRAESAPQPSRIFAICSGQALRYGSLECQLFSQQLKPSTKTRNV